MSEPMDLGEALQRALYDRLRATPDVADRVAGQFYDDVPKAAVFPYVTIPDFHDVEDGADGVVADEVFFDLHVWSRAVGRIEAKAIAGALRRALDGADLSFAGDHVLVDLAFRSTRLLDDPDGRTTHAVVSFKALTETVTT